MEKDFARWSTKKETIDANSVRAKPREREIWWCSIGMNVGSEENGKGDDFARPVLILRRLNQNIFLGLPLTSTLKKNTDYYPIIFKGHRRSVKLSQIRAWDNKRLLRYIGKLERNDFRNIKKSLTEILK